MIPSDLPPDELAVAAKALDVHRQSLIRKLDRVGNNANERKRTLQEIASCSSAATRFREAHDAILAERVAS
jgi:hypothetical protein